MSRPGAGAGEGGKESKSMIVTIYGTGDIEIEGRDRKAARAALEQAADKLLANTLIENYQVELK